MNRGLPVVIEGRVGGRGWLRIVLCLRCLGGGRSVGAVVGPVSELEPHLELRSESSVLDNKTLRAVPEVCVGGQEKVLVRGIARVERSRFRHWR